MSVASARKAAEGGSVASPPVLGRAGYGLATAGLALALVSYGAVYAPVRIGMWPDIEPVIPVLHAAAALSALGLALMLAVGDRPAVRAGRAVAHPYVLVLFAESLVAIATAPFARYPLSMLIGAPETAEGALLYAELAVFVAAGLMARAHRPTMRALVWGAAAVSWIAAAASVWGKLFVFNDWLAFYAIGVAVSVAASGGSVRFGRMRVRGAPLGLAAALPSLVISENLSAIVLVVALGVPLWAATRRVRLRGGISARAIRRGGAALAVLMPACVIAGVAILGPTGLVESIRSRARVDQVVFAQFADAPGTLLHGLGWGQAGETFFRYLTAANATVYNQSWDLVFRDYQHTHDFALEALLSGGIAALVLALLAVAMIPLWCRRDRLALGLPFAAVLSGVAAFWFQFPMTWPALALAMSAIGRTRPAIASRRVRAAALVGLAVLAAASVAACLFLLQFGLAVRAALDGPVAMAGPGSACLAFPAEDWRGDIALRYAMVQSYQALEQTRTPGSAAIARTAALACDVDRRSDHIDSALLASAGLLFRGDIAFDPRLRALDPAFPRLLDDWVPRLRRLLSYAPDRSDLAIPYLGWRLQAHDLAAITEMTDAILARRPEDPVGLWFSGLAMIQSSDPAVRKASLFRLRSALDHGIERLMPVDAKQKAQILAATAATR